MSRVLGIVYRAIQTHLIQQAGCTRAAARTGAVTLIQRFGSVAKGKAKEVAGKVTGDKSATESIYAMIGL